MERVLFMILVNGVPVAKEVELSDAMIFAKALFEAAYNDRNMVVSIKRMDAEEKEGETDD